MRVTFLVAASLLTAICIGYCKPDGKSTKYPVAASPTNNITAPPAGTCSSTISPGIGARGAGVGSGVGVGGILEDGKIFVGVDVGGPVGGTLVGGDVGLAEVGLPVG